MPAPLLLMTPLVLPVLKAAIAATASVAVKMSFDEIRNSGRVEYYMEGLKIYFVLNDAKSNIDITDFDSGNLPPIAKKVYYDLSSQLEDVARPDLREVKLSIWRAFDEIGRSSSASQNFTIDDIKYSS